MKGPPVSTGGPSGAYSEVGVAFWRNQRSGGTGNDVALMGAGDDTFVWNPGDGSDTVEGQAGFDTLRSTAPTSPSRSTFGERRTGPLHPHPSDGPQRRRAHRLKALGGADTIHVHDTEVSIDLGVAGGDGAADTVVIHFA